MRFDSMPEYYQERVRSEKIVSFVIADLWLFMAKHLKANHPVQFMYLYSQIRNYNGDVLFKDYLEKA